MIIPDVSIIVPVYNVEQFLPRCINSIICQSLKNIEVILINDGSTDHSGQICEDFAKLDDRIKVIHKKNGGLSDARNVGLDIAKGHFIAFVDSDDYIHEKMYSILLETMIENDCDVAESGYIEVQDTKIIHNNPIGNIKIYQKKEAVISAIMDHHCRNFVWNKLYKKELWENIRFPIGKLYEDVYTTYRVFNKCSKVVKIEQTLYFYFQRPNSIVNSHFTINKLDHCDALEGMMIFIEREYPEAAPLTSIKYLMMHLEYFQELLIHRKRIENSDFYIKNLTEKLISKKYKKYLKIDIKWLCQKVCIDNYQTIFKQKMLIKIKLFLLRRSVWLFYTFNKFIKYVKLMRLNKLIQ